MQRCEAAAHPAGGVAPVLGRGVEVEELVVGVERGARDLDAAVHRTARLHRRDVEQPDTETLVLVAEQVLARIDRPVRTCDEGLVVQSDDRQPGVSGALIGRDPDGVEDDVPGQCAAL